MANSPKRLAQRKGAAIDLTTCGTLLLHLGPMALKLEPEALVGLHELLGQALDELDYGELVDEKLDQVELDHGEREPAEAKAGTESGDGTGMEPDAGEDPAWMERILRRGRATFGN